ncbi:GNAT family N-acetyltransferase [Alteromonas gilva]|uniref:GNAT family N-acetyltransferase n=1 Tax=Alteromonas gilva TaxID=2987522 RepID=A0ABT5KX16_9ALTE|nr:GNAT family N-acetyltransferase [Alteromonas gilva]MDC8829305.1 GNAT family N-acetyltransferase [Alteromonas gilva]
MPCSSIIRNAEKNDGSVAVDLLFSAGKYLLTEVFGMGHPDTAFDYLLSAWDKGGGQYGYQNHWVAETDGEITGLVSCWHNQLPEDFDRLTLASIVDHYGIDNALEIVMRSQRYLALLESPLFTELGIGHLAVSEKARRKGIGAALINFMEIKGQGMQKNALVLNCSVDNHGAIAFYKKLGFGVHRSNDQFVQMIKALQIGTGNAGER